MVVATIEFGPDDRGTAPPVSSLLCFLQSPRSLPPWLSLVASVSVPHFPSPSLLDLPPTVTPESLGIRMVELERAAREVTQSRTRPAEGAEAAQEEAEVRGAVVHREGHANQLPNSVAKAVSAHVTVACSDGNG